VIGGFTVIAVEAEGGIGAGELGCVLTRNRVCRAPIASMTRSVQGDSAVPFCLRVILQLSLFGRRDDVSSCFWPRCQARDMRAIFTPTAMS
jgi:hypothetical protein